MTKDQEKLFTNAGLKADDYVGILSMILAAPEVVAKNLGVAGVVRVAVECAGNIPNKDVLANLNYIAPDYGLGALS